MADNILILDTSSDAVCVAVGSSNTDATDILMDEKARHGENLFATLAEALKQQNVDLKSLKAIGVGIGPGSFTGLRIGIIAAHSLAHALSIPVVYISSLELVALGEVQPPQASYPPVSDGEVRPPGVSYPQDEQEEFVVYRDARRKEFYYAKFEAEKVPVYKIEIDGVAVASVLNRIDSEQLIPAFETNLEVNIKPSAAIELVQQALEQGIIANTFSAQAIYIRKSDAELSWNVKK